MLNASTLLVVARLVVDLEEDVRMARECVVKGKAWEALQGGRIGRGKNRDLIGYIRCVCLLVGEIRKFECVDPKDLYIQVQ